MLHISENGKNNFSSFLVRRGACILPWQEHHGVVASGHAQAGDQEVDTTRQCGRSQEEPVQGP